jgi:hypothetical protein
MKAGLHAPRDVDWLDPVGPGGPVSHQYAGRYLNAEMPVRT